MIYFLQQPLTKQIRQKKSFIIHETFVCIVFLNQRNLSIMKNNYFQKKGDKNYGSARYSELRRDRVFLFIAIYHCERYNSLKVGRSGLQLLSLNELSHVKEEKKKKNVQCW